MSYQLIAVVISCYQLASLDINTFFSRSHIGAQFPLMAVHGGCYQSLSVVVFRYHLLSVVIS
jgi:hypothetical protein